MFCGETPSIWFGDTPVHHIVDGAGGTGRVGWIRGSSQRLGLAVWGSLGIRKGFDIVNFRGLCAEVDAEEVLSVAISPLVLTARRLT